LLRSAALQSVESREFPEGSLNHRGLETIVRNARAQSQLIDDLLEMSRIVSGKIRLDVQRVDLISIIETVLESVQPSLTRNPSSCARLSIHVPGKSLVIQITAERSAR
jgi:signal transduction histidine kinase